MKNNLYQSFLRVKNIKWVFLFIVLGACIFFIRPCTSFEEIEILIPVEVTNIPKGLIVTGQPLRSIEVNVRCPVYMVNKLSDLNVHYLIDLSGATAGVHSVKIEQKRIVISDNVSITGINPSFLAVRIDKEIVKQLPVEIAISGRPDAGFYISHTLAEPSYVVLRGSKHILSKMEKVKTRPVDVSGFSESFKKETYVDIHEELHIISPDKITIVSVFIDEIIESRKFSNIPVVGQNVSYAYTITPLAINIEIQGAVNILENLSVKDDIQVFIDLKGLKMGTYVRRASIIIPIKTTLVDAKPDKFTVKVTNAIKFEK